MSQTSYVELRQNLPPSVKQIIARGGDCWIGEVDDMTVLKGPHLDEGMKVVRIEAKMFGIRGNHSRIIQSKGLTKDGLLLEFAPNGNLHDYLTNHPEVPLDQRGRVLHCDIRHDNFLLDSRLGLKLADFQGQHFSETGEILLDALSVESTKAYLPRKPADHASVRTDLFALGSSIYFIMMGHEVFPDLDKSKDEDEIERRFREGQFPTDLHACAAVTARCWRQRYLSAEQVLSGLEAIREAAGRGESLNYIAKSVILNTGEGDAPSTTPWLDGLCKETQTPKIPPPYRQLIGFR